MDALAIGFSLLIGIPVVLILGFWLIALWPVWIVLGIVVGGMAIGGGAGGAVVFLGLVGVVFILLFILLVTRVIR